MPPTTTFETLINRRDDAEAAIDNHLRRRGWNYVCDTPGSFWFWSKEYKGRVLLMSRDHAIALEVYLEEQEIQL